MHLPDSEFTRPPAARPRTPGPGKAQAPSGIVTIGRDPHCDHTIDSPLVSREHARLISEDGGIYVEDLKSTNGTFVNGQRPGGRGPRAARAVDRACVWGSHRAVV